MELLHGELVRGDDDDVVEGGLGHGRGLGLPCGLGISLLCSWCEDDRLELSLHKVKASQRSMEPVGQWKKVSNKLKVLKKAFKALKEV